MKRKRKVQYLKVRPSKRLVELVLNYNWEVEKPWFLAENKCLGLLRGIPFTPINYLGSGYIKFGKIKQKSFYTFLKSTYRGAYLRTALKFLGKRYVRFFYYCRSKNMKDESVLLIGTNEGTFGIAPFLNFNGQPYQLSKLIKPSEKLRREIVFESI